MTATPALIIAAAGVGLGHAILPDHWVPLAVVGRTQRYSLGRVARLAGLAGVAHVLVSIILGGIIIAVGLQFRSAVSSAQDTIVGGLLIATGIGFAVLELTGHGHSHDHPHDHGHPHDHAHPHDHEHDPGQELAAHGDAAHDHAADEHAAHEHAAHHHAAHEHAAVGAATARRPRSLLAVMVPFGAAASPDLTILPVFLAATTVGTGAAIGSLIAFSAVTIGTIVTLTLVATAGGYQVGGRWLDRWGNTITAVVLVVIGALVLAGIL